MKKLLLLLFVFCFSIGTLFAQTVATPQMQMYMGGTLKIMQNGSPVEGALVTAFNESHTSDSNGEVSIENFMTGEANVKVDFKNLEYNKSLNINTNNESLDISTGGNPISNSNNNPETISKSNTKISKIVVGIFVILAILISVSIIYFIIKKKELKIYKFLRIKKIFSHNKSKAFFMLLSTFIIGALLLAQAVSITNIASLFTDSHASTNNLPVPSNIVVEQDDGNALLYWNNQSIPYYQNEKDRIDANQSGYAIYWGHYDTKKHSITENPPLLKVSTEPNIQLQPLDATSTYAATIATVDNKGNISAFSPLITFKSDPTRVNALKQKMTGFFDSFNTAGHTQPFNELNWNNAYTACASPTNIGQFINTQNHAHSRVYDQNCDRGANTSRPRAVVDIPDGSNPNDLYRTITFDMDGTQRRDFWYLDLYPTSDGPIDSEGHTSLDSIDVTKTGQGNASPTPPNNTLRIVQSGDSIHIFTFGSDGWETNPNYKLENSGKISLDSSGNPIDLSNNCGELAFIRYCKDQNGNSSPEYIVKNYRRHWRITVNKNNLSVFNDNYLNGVLTGSVLLAKTQNSLNLSFRKAYTNWVLFSYNTPKSNEQSSLLHWDNFGFDGPSQTTEVHNYIDGVISSTNYTMPSQLNRTIQIPDNLSGATSARLMFTAQLIQNTDFKWHSTNNVIINGNKYLIPNPQDKQLFPQNSGIAPSVLIPEQITIPLNLQTLKTSFGTTTPNTNPVGINQIQYNTGVNNQGDIGVFNAHIEVDYPKASAPAYTQPINIYPSLNYNPSMPDIGPGVSISSFYDSQNNKTDFGTSGYWSGGDSVNKANGNKGAISNPINMSGINTMNFSGDDNIALNGEGLDPGINEYNIILDRKIVKTVDTHSIVPAPSFISSYSLDTTQLCNGLHEIYVEAFNIFGTASIPDYFQGEENLNGKYFPIFINTSNNGRNSCQPISDVPSSLNLAHQLPLWTNSITPFPTPIITTTPAPTTTIVPTPPISGEIKYIQSAVSNTKICNSNNSTVVLANPVIDGNTILVGLETKSFKGTVPSITNINDNHGNNYIKATVSVNNDSTTSLWYSNNVKGGSNFQINASMNSNNCITIMPSEYSGLNGGIDQVNQLSGSGINTTSGLTNTTLQNNELIVGLSSQSAGCTDFNSNNNYILRQSQNCANQGALFYEDKIVNSMGKYEVTGVLAKKSNWNAIVTTFKTHSTATNSFIGKYYTFGDSLNTNYINNDVSKGLKNPEGGNLVRSLH